MPVWCRLMIMTNSLGFSILWLQMLLKLKLVITAQMNTEIFEMIESCEQQIMAMAVFDNLFCLKALFFLLLSKRRSFYWTTAIIRKVGRRKKEQKRHTMDDDYGAERTISKFRLCHRVRDLNRLQVWKGTKNLLNIENGHICEKPVGFYRNSFFIFYFWFGSNELNFHWIW